MAAPTGLLFVDSFDHYNTQAQQQRKWNQTKVAVVFDTGRSGSGQSIKIGAATAGAQAKTLEGFEYLTMAAGVAYKTQAFANSILYFFDIAGHTWSLSHVGSGILKFSQFGGPSVTLTGFSMNLNTWYFIEVYFSIAGANCTYNIRINNVSIGSGTLAGWTSTGAILVGLDAPGGGNVAWYDDLYATDGELFGDTAWGVIYPNAPGDASDWTPNPAVANWNNTKEHAPDDLTSVVDATTVGNQDLYNMDDLGGTFVIKGIQALNCGIKSAAGIASYKGSLKTNATLYQEAEHGPSFGGWIYQRTPLRKNPVTGVDWTSAEIDAIQRGALRVT